MMRSNKEREILALFDNTDIRHLEKKNFFKDSWL